MNKILDLDTSIAEHVNVSLYDIDDKPLSVYFCDPADPLVKLDLINYAFEFRLMKGSSVNKTYQIPSGSDNSAFLTKTDANKFLNMKLMWEDVTTICTPPSYVVDAQLYRLLMVVTDDAGSKFVYIIFNIHAKRY